MKNINNKTVKTRLNKINYLRKIISEKYKKDIEKIDRLEQKIIKKCSHNTVYSSDPSGDSGGYHCDICGSDL